MKCVTLNRRAFANLEGMKKLITYGHTFRLAAYTPEGYKRYKEGNGDHAVIYELWTGQKLYHKWD